VRQRPADVVVYGGTPAGVTAAVAAARLGASVLVLEPSRHIGGLSTSGLVTAESEHMLLDSFSGLALEFYTRLGRAYGQPGPVFYWESKIAEMVFEELLAGADVPVRFGSLLERVDKRDDLVRAVALTDGTRVEGRVFVDASYEGDLMATAEVAHAVGRESRAQYREPLAGVRFIEAPTEVAAFVGDVTVDTPIDVSPYADGGLLPGVLAPDGIVVGDGDDKPMAYNFRVTVSNGADRVAIEPRPRYDAARFELLARYLHRRPDVRLEELIAFSPFPSGRYTVAPDGRTRAQPREKWELNNRQNAVLSLGHLGGQFAYPGARHDQRRAIWHDHREHNQGLLYFLAHDPDVPIALRREAARWGLAPDEYPDHEHWPLPALRARGPQDDRKLRADPTRPPPRSRKRDAVALGSHWIDSHDVQRIAINARQFRNEGRIWAAVDKPFHIPYRTITPRREECANLLVPVCASASKVAFCALRLEPTWMALGHAAGAAATLALEREHPVQQVDVSLLQERLRADGMRL
jgi:hypothetical protein